ncbi:recombinase family protein [Peptoniphilaceae bacterium SGI.137]|nr:recombinase family protein [Peptoniphilaceae bacterium]
MEQQKKATTILAFRTRFSSTPLAEKKKRKVAGYTRVSTDHNDQFTSYEAQIDYCTNYIKGRDVWKFVNVYTDEGISDTSIKKRIGFQNIIKNALAENIDLIVTGSVSRFARNTVKSLTTIRKLKENRVECYFEKENI